MESDIRPREYASVPHVLAIGSAGHQEFSDALRQVDSSAHARLLCDWQSARDSLNHTASLPDLVILLRNRPDGMFVGDVAKLTKLAPKSRFVWLLGSWCEGEAHTGQTWDGLEKVYWHTFSHWWDRYRREFNGYDDYCDEPANSSGSQIAVVHTESVLTFEAIADSLSVAGCSAVWQHPHRPAPLLVSNSTASAVVGIWEGGQLISHEQESLRTFRKSLEARTPLVTLLDFPQFDQVRLAHDLGATAVLGKPWKEGALIAACVDAGISQKTPSAGPSAKPQAA